MNCSVSQPTMIHTQQMGSTTNKNNNNNENVTESLNCSSLATNSNITASQTDHALGASTVFSQSGELKLDMFEVGKFLGSGAYGRAYLARLKNFPFICALKVMYKNKLIQENVGCWKQIRREIDLQKGMYHTNIIRLYGWFYDENRLFLVQEYASKGNLYDLILKNGPFEATVAGRVVWDIAQALRFLHNRQIIHRDIKAENILLTDTCAKLTDFGWSIHSPKIQINRANNKYKITDGVARRTTLCGTMDYYSPEMVSLSCGMKTSYDAGVDIWALGILLYELITTISPFYDYEIKTTMRNIFNTDINYVQMPPEIPADAQHLIRLMLCKDTTKRASITTVINHPFMIRCSKLKDISAIFKKREDNGIPSVPTPKDAVSERVEDSDLLSESD